MHLLIVEDDRALADMLQRKLVGRRYSVDVVHDGVAALEYAASGAYDAVILDLMLPRMDGFAVARRLRSDGVGTPVIMLTARDAIQDRVAGFGAGADDYLIKPFAFEELEARLQAVTRRGALAPEADVLVVGDLILDRRSREVTRAGNPIPLAPRDFALLEYLMRHPGQALSRTVILERVWDYGFESFANVVDATIRRLRKAIDDGYEQPLIHTVRGLGYKIKA
ncbi:MAG TPA: response regulator transcription factor [Chloroflexota bacterium]|nr:response regulator transcription factor [Chloroflexota bacterium]